MKYTQFLSLVPFTNSWGILPPLQVTTGDYDFPGVPLKSKGQRTIEDL